MPTLEEKIESRRLERKIEKARARRSSLDLDTSIPMPRAPSQPATPRDEQFLVSPQGETQLRQDRPVRQAISRAVRPVLESGLSSLGGAVALTGSILDPVPGDEIPAFLAGEGLGFAAGKSLSDTFDALLGLPTSRNTRTLKETAKDIPSDVGEGVALSAAGQSLGAAINLGFNKFFGPSKKFTLEKQELSRIARENDINLTPAELTDGSGVRLFESLLDKVISSSGQLQKNHLQTLESLTVMTEKLKAKGAPAEVVEILGNRIQEATRIALKSREDINSTALVKVKDRVVALLGTQRGAIDTGEAIQSSLKIRSKKASALVSDADNRFWDTIRPNEEIPDEAAQVVANKFLAEDSEVPLRSGPLKRLLKKIAKQPVDSKNEIAESLGLSRQAFDSLDQAQLQEALLANGLIEEVPTASTFRLRMTELNQIIKEEDLAIKSGIPGFKGQSSRDGGIAKLIKTALKKDLQEFSVPQGGEVLNRFNEFNAIAGRFKKLYGSEEMSRIIRSDPASVVDTIIKPNNINEFRIFRKASTSQQVEELREAFIMKLVGSEDQIDPKLLLNRMKRFNPQVLREVLGQKNIGSLRKIATRTDAIKSLNPSDPLFRTLVKRDPGQVFDSIIKKSSKASRTAVDADNILRLNKLEAEGILDEVGIERIRARYLEEVFSPNRQGNLSPKTMLDVMESFGERTKARLLPPDMAQDLNAIASISKVAEGAEKLAGRPGGGGQNIISFSSIGMMLRHPIKNTPVLVLAPQTLAKLYTSSFARKLLVEGFSAPVGTARAAEIFTKLAGIALSEKDIEFLGQEQEVAGQPPSQENPQNPELGGL